MNLEQQQEVGERAQQEEEVENENGSQPQQATSATDNMNSMSDESGVIEGVVQQQQQQQDTTESTPTPTTKMRDSNNNSNHSQRPGAVRVAGIYHKEHSSSSIRDEEEGGATSATRATHATATVSSLYQQDNHHNQNSHSDDNNTTSAAVVISAYKVTEDEDERERVSRLERQFEELRKELAARSGVGSKPGASVEEAATVDALVITPASSSSTVPSRVTPVLPVSHPHHEYAPNHQDGKVHSPHYAHHRLHQNNHHNHHPNDGHHHHHHHHNHHERRPWYVLLTLGSLLCCIVAVGVITAAVVMIVAKNNAHSYEQEDHQQGEQPTTRPTGASNGSGDDETGVPCFQGDVPCASACVTVSLMLQTDFYPEETTLTLTNSADDTARAWYFVSGNGLDEYQEYNMETAICPDECYTFRITDAAGDGLTSEFNPDGRFELYYDGQLTASAVNFGFQFETVVGGMDTCPCFPGDVVCGAECVMVQLDLQTDFYPSETAVRLFNPETGAAAWKVDDFDLEFEPYTFLARVCPEKACYQFQILDEGGDGLMTTGADTDVAFSLYYHDETVVDSMVEFGSIYETTLGGQEACAAVASEAAVAAVSSP